MTDTSLPRVTQLLSSTKKVFDQFCWLADSSGLCEPTYVNMPWTDLIDACIHYKLVSLRTGHISLWRPVSEVLISFIHSLTHSPTFCHSLSYILPHSPILTVNVSIFTKLYLFGRIPLSPSMCLWTFLCQNEKVIMSSSSVFASEWQWLKSLQLNCNICAFQPYLSVFILSAILICLHPFSPIYLSSPFHP